MKEFRNIIHKIKSDTSITNKYRALKKSQGELKNKIINSSDFDNVSVLNANIDKKLTILKDKYNILSKKRIIIIDDSQIDTGNSFENEKFNSILDEVQLNLIKNDIYKT
jgi:uncharacterized protein related to proFAR isomerase